MWTWKTDNTRFCTCLMTENSKFSAMHLTTCPRKLTKEFLEVCFYNEQIALEIGPRFPEMAKICTFEKIK